MEEVNQKQIAERIEQLVEKFKSPRAFAIEVNIDPGNFQRKRNASQPWTVNDINKICGKLGIRKGWLLNGEGQMCVAPEETLEMIPARSYNAHVGVPYYNVDFDMGYDFMEPDTTSRAAYMINFTPYNKCDAWCNATGNSMLPTIASGDIIALKKINDFHFLISGEIYAIVTTNDLRTIKRIKDNGSTITLIPDNKDYPEQTIDKQEIRMVFQVMGSMKKF